VNLISEFERILTPKIPDRHGGEGSRASLRTKANPHSKSVKRVKIEDEGASFLELAVQYGLTAYIKKQIERDHSTLNLPWHRPLLSHALAPSAKCTQDRIADPSAMVSLLLEHGADPNYSCEIIPIIQDRSCRYSIWQDYLKYICTSSTETG